MVEVTEKVNRHYFLFTPQNVASMFSCHLEEKLIIHYAV